MITDPNSNHLDSTPVNLSIIKSYGYTSSINFAAAAVKLNDLGEATHAGIIINYNRKMVLFHYDGDQVQFQSVPPEWYFHKDFIFVDDFLVRSFYAHCVLAHQAANPKYGFVFPDSFYANREYFSADDVPEYMTCVGFCINVIQGYLLNELYIDCEGWEIDTIFNQKKWVIDFLELFKKDNPGFSEDVIKKYLKRVAPDEYLASSFLNDYPIRKAHIDPIIDRIRQDLKTRVAVSEA